MDRGEFFKPNSVHAIKARGFPVWYFLSTTLSVSGCMFTWWSVSSIHNSVSMFFIHSTFYDLPIPTFCSKFFCLCRIRLLIWLRRFSPCILVDFFRCLGTFCFFFIVRSCLRIFLVFLISPVFFGWSPQVLFFVLVAVLFQFCPNIS